MMSNLDQDAAKPEEHGPTSGPSTRFDLSAVTWRLHAFSTQIGFVEFILSRTRLRK
jgi:hypothetical protein